MGNQTVLEKQLSKEKKLIWTAGYEDPVFFLKTFLPEWFPDYIPWVHRGILAILRRKTNFLTKYGELDKIVRHFVWVEDPDAEDSPEHPLFSYNDEGGLDLIVNQFTEIILPRGFSKTTLVNGNTISDIVYKLTNFTVMISEAGKHAEMQLESIKRQLETNMLIKDIFGELQPARNASEKWTNDFIETTNGVAIATRGRGSQVRGLLHNGKRPDRILLDDVEDSESVMTELQREKVRQWFYKDVVPALPKRGTDHSIVALGTILHSEALLLTMQRDPRFNCVRFGAIDKDGEALWDAQMSLKKLASEKHAYARVGQLGAYYLEYHSQLRDEDTAKFKKHYIIIAPPVGDKDENGVAAPLTLHKALIIDPAISDKPGADYVALYVVGMSQKGLIWVLDEHQERGMSPRAQINMFFKLYKRWKPDKVGVEAIAYQAALVHLLREEMFRQHTYFEIEEITHKIKKTERVEGILQPRYAAGYIRHARHFPYLETQLLDWPRGKMDGPDALSMAVSLLDPYAAEAADPEVDLTDDEFEPIEKVMGGDWRVEV